MAVRTINYEPPVFIRTAIAAEADMREVARQLGLQIAIERRGWLYRSLHVTISGSDEALQRFPIELAKRFLSKYRVDLPPAP